MRPSSSRSTVDGVAPAREVLGTLGLAEVGVDGVELQARLGATPPERVSSALVHAGVDLVGLEVRRRSLEQLFVELTGEGFDVAR